jgi:hypothetical protein
MADVHAVGDVALTLYYDASDDCGLNRTWIALDEQLPTAASSALLGTPFGPPGAQFDPGRQGSFFQSPEEVVTSLEVLNSACVPELQRFIDLLASASMSGRGIYVTF